MEPHGRCDNGTTWWQMAQVGIGAKGGGALTGSGGWDSGGAAGGPAFATLSQARARSSVEAATLPMCTLPIAICGDPSVGDRDGPADPSDGPADPNSRRRLQKKVENQAILKTNC